MEIETEKDLKELAKQAMEIRGFLADFSKEVESEIKEIVVTPPIELSDDVRDMRDKLWFSIDNDDSRDLDQTTYIETTKNGSFKAFVAIADVSLVVHKGSAINEHAEHNTTSVYTPAVIFPMLPEELSTDLTSLNENQDRYAFVTELDIDQEGVIQHYTVYKALIKNKAKLAYNAVSYWLDTNEKAPEAVLKNENLQAQLKIHDLVAQKMKAYRQRLGSLSLETIEAKAIIKNQMIIDIVEEKKNRAKDIIENLMIGANQASIKFLHQHGFPAFKRIVRIPKRWDKIVEIAVKLGKNLPSEPDSKALEIFLIEEKIRDPDRFPDLSLSVVKLLGRGEYVVEYPGDEAPGHFGLAIKNYSHSTAPNRRYPDLITQRMLRAVLEKKKNPYTKKEIERLAEYCTLKEADADKVTRQIQKTAGAILLSNKIGETFEGIITGVTKDGTWVRIFTPPVDGKLVKTKAHIDVGDHVTVKLILTDVKKGFIDFALIEELV